MAIDGAAGATIAIGRPMPLPAAAERARQFGQETDVRKGRGAISNPKNRFEAAATSPFDDGWPIDASPLGAPLPTELIRDNSRTVISYNRSPDLGFDRSLNAYRGCEHGCIYCFARPTHAYLGYSAGTDFETKLLFKPDVARLLEAEIGKPGYVPRPIALGSNTDPYQPVERTLRLTRSVLEVLAKHHHPFTIVTKSSGILRDLDIIAPMAERRQARVYISLTTLDADLARRMEPRATAPSLRLQAMSHLAEAGVPVSVLAAPMIPGLNDSELESILAASARVGASHAGYVLLRLPLEVAKLFEDWIHAHYPDRARRVLNLIRETRGGSLNDSAFGDRFVGTGAFADLLRRRFAVASKKLGFADREDLDCSRFSRPHAAAGAQLSLL
jgi:DNA repair photolyase